MNVSNRPVGACRPAGIARLTSALHSFRPFAALAAVVLAAVPLLAQTGTGTVSGRIFTPANGEYIRNVEVSVAGTNLATQTEGNGFYQLFNVPAGDVTLNVRYPGYTSVDEKITVTAG